jgi:predicted transcriptional regulator
MTVLFLIRHNILTTAPLNYKINYMITLSNYIQKIDNQFVDTLPKELKENHFHFLKLKKLIDEDITLLEDETIKTELLEHLELINEYYKGQVIEKTLEKLCFPENYRNSKITEFLDNKTNLKNGTKSESQSVLQNRSQNSSINDLTEFEEAIISQRENKSGETNRQIYERFGASKTCFLITLRRLIKKGVIKSTYQFVITGRPKK